MAKDWLYQHVIAKVCSAGVFDFQLLLKGPNNGSLHCVYNLWVQTTGKDTLEINVDMYGCMHEQMKNSCLFLGDVADSNKCLLKTELKADDAVLRQQL